MDNLEPKPETWRDVLIDFAGLLVLLAVLLLGTIAFNHWLYLQACK